MRKVVFNRKNGHSFFDFYGEFSTRSVCVDGWLNPALCPSFCKPVLVDGWKSLHSDKTVDFEESLLDVTLFCPTSFGFVSRRGAYRRSGAYHTNLILKKTELYQFLHNL